jgi:8-oxo-dGTP pyrophosphatase MutT (NUDIX family)
MSMTADPIVQRSERLVYDNRFVTVYDDDVTMADGSDGTYLRIVESDGRAGVAILPLATSKVALVRTFRYPLGEWEWGIPRGFGDWDDPEISARAELAEELGSGPDDIRDLGELTPNSGLLSSRVRLFLARYSTEVVQPADTGEVSGVRWVTMPELCDEIRCGGLVDSFTLGALSLAAIKGHLILS